MLFNYDTIFSGTLPVLDKIDHQDVGIPSVIADLSDILNFLLTRYGRDSDEVLAGRI